MAEKKNKGGMALRVRPPAFGLPTACPKCLPSLLYLRLANITFWPEYSAAMPDSDDLPMVELGLLVGFASEPGGVEEFLRTEKLGDLDADLAEVDRSELKAFKSLLVPLSDALQLELWSRENESIAHKIYVSHLPWPINRAIEWNMRRKLMNRLGVNKENAKDREAEIYKCAFDAYEAFSAKKQMDSLYLVSDKPTSLDAMLLAHILFVLSVPLVGSILKDELVSKHPLLVQYAESMKDTLLKSNEPSPSDSVKSPPTSPRASSHASSSSRDKDKGTNPEPKRKQTPKEKEFRKRGKMFVMAQLAALVAYIVYSGLPFEEDDGDDNGHDDD
ncbi:hypothetical protein SELMODRAFT_447229 [Selaginella moellendorffii]|uniref:Metaxin n=1 Tax=Selaginella moellendorffii TaxID=88036 RepID=D8SXW1_SELML|nr:mitochondrial outer membrane import complex protein METAXIN [Selaginella moellendorffii]XP_024517844.1 mitochondrial outer membrane import complex protein METAXIN [Selaginella moellendorffii]EFJ10593.1 hypothetical protein SELMODRAFT_447229 [Selaginella moellendorffii]|eukprot:XP_002988174.1 mitochondrial outer membrane import complex protein METAXIN [Selaginella moellendorffii]